jgi:hypothetical protein
MPGILTPDEIMLKVPLSEVKIYFNDRIHVLDVCFLPINNESFDLTDLLRTLTGKEMR